ncbi:MAG: hypothetical protein AB8B63_23310 [Granulosicoccus sp.]
MRKLAVSIIAAASLSGCASTGVDKPDKPDLLGTLAFCAGQSLTPEHAERQLPLLGWTPQKESNTALELVFWTSFGRDYVSNTYPFTDESFGELVAGADLASRQTEFSPDSCLLVA